MTMPVNCDVPGCTAGPFKGAQGLRMHKTRTHGQPPATNRPAVVKTPSISKAVAREQELALVVTKLWPKGIPTKNLAELVDALSFIEQIRHRMNGATSG